MAAPDGIRLEHNAIEVDGRERRYTLVVPDGAAERPPLLIAFHGSNGSAARLRAASGHTFDRLATREGVVVAYPEGVKKHWNDARASIDFATRREGVDDIAFVRALVDDLVVRAGIDRHRVFVVGFSNGGQFVIRLLLEAAELVAGAATIGATVPAAGNLAPDVVVREGAVPLVTIHGTKDPLVPFGGGMASLWGLKPRGEGRSAAETARFFAHRNGIDSEPICRATTEGALPIEVEDFVEPGRPGVRRITVVGGGHTVPNAVYSAPAPLGRTAHDLDAGEAIWSFLTRPAG